MPDPDQTPPPRRHFSLRRLITFLVVLSSFIMLASGVVLFFAPAGQIAKQVDWRLAFLDRADWQTLHLSFSVIFVLAGIAHLVFNWRTLRHHLRDRISRHLTLKIEAVVALVVVLWIGLSAIVGLPPASTLHDLNAYFRRTFWLPHAPAGSPAMMLGGVLTAKLSAYD